MRSLETERVLQRHYRKKQILANNAVQNQNISVATGKASSLVPLTILNR